MSGRTRLLAALAAKVLDRPVRIQLTRAQMYSMAGHQPATIQTIALGADSDGKLDRHSPSRAFRRHPSSTTTSNTRRSRRGRLWAGAAAESRRTTRSSTSTATRRPRCARRTRRSAISRSRARWTSSPMRPASIRSRCACSTTPRSIRLAGGPSRRAPCGKCLTEGAARFGWDKRTPEPRSMRDGRYLIGQGVAAAIYTHWRWPAKARVTLNRDGTALVEAGSHDLGTGTYTVMRQVAADALGLAPGEGDRAARAIRDCPRPTPRSARRRWPMPAPR